MSTTSVEKDPANRLSASSVPELEADSGRMTPSGEGQGSLFERLGGLYGIAGAVDVLVDRLYDNASANRNPHVQAFHSQGGQAGFKFLVTAWSIEQTGGPQCYPGRDMHESHAHLSVSEFEFDIVAGEIAATLYHVGVPPLEHAEFMQIIERYRPMVVGPPETSTPAVADPPTRTADLG